MKSPIFFFVLLFFISCNQNSNSSVESNASKIKKKEFLVSIEYKSNSPDKFKLIMDNIKVDEFQRKSIVITEDVVATTSLDFINANFGENISSRIVLNLGNKEVKKVVINELIMSYGDNSIIIDGNSILDSFKLNEFVEFDSTSKELKTKRINNNHAPALILKPKVINQLMN